jgi:hypothetical protein
MCREVQMIHVPNVQMPRAILGGLVSREMLRNLLSHNALIWVQSEK